MTSERATTLSEALARGRKAAEQLGSATDQLTETIARIERALGELRFGVSASIQILSEHYEEEGLGFVEETRLAFRKVGKRWTLVLDIATGPNCEQDWTTTPLVNASRELRLLAIAKLPDLIDAMVAVSEEQLAEVCDGQMRADEVLATLTELAPKKGTPRFVVPKITPLAVESDLKVKKP